MGTSSITDEGGRIVEHAIAKLCAEVAELRSAGDQVVVVTSGAVAAGLPVLGLHPRPSDPAVLQAVSAVGQSRLMGHYDRSLAAAGLVGGQVLLAPLDFWDRSQYLHARETLRLLLGLGVVPVVNENDAIADDEIRFGDNDRLAALVANLLQADLLVLLTDAAGLFTSDPRLGKEASLIEEVLEVDEVLALAGGPGSPRGSGGMASKLAAAKIAAWSGVRVVIASAERPRVLQDAVAGTAGVGTVVWPRAGSPPRPQTMDRLRRWPPRGRSWWTREPGAPWSKGASLCSRRAYGKCAAISRPRTPLRWPARTGRSSPRGSSATVPRRSGNGRACGPRRCRPTCLTRSSIATTWSSCPNGPQVHIPHDERTGAGTACPQAVVTYSPR